jgi:hypothetical protein
MLAQKTKTVALFLRGERATAALVPSRHIVAVLIAMSVVLLIGAFVCSRTFQSITPCVTRISDSAFSLVLS